MRVKVRYARGTSEEQRECTRMSRRVVSPGIPPVPRLLFLRKLKSASMATH